MAGLPSDGALETLRFPGGVDLTVEEQALGPGSLREAVNVDIRRDGSWLARAGYTKRVPLTFAHSLFADPDFPLMLVRDGAQLLAIDPAMETEVVASNLGDGPASYQLLNGEVLWTVEGVASGRYNGMQSLPLGLRAPANPVLSATSFGGLAAGTYRVAVSAVDASGVEGALSDTVHVVVAANGAIALHVPGNVPGAAALRVYRSEADGEALWFAGTFLGNTVLGAGALGDGPDTADLSPLPAGHIVRELNGVVWMADGHWLRHGVPMRPFLSEPAVNFLPMPARVDLLEPVGQGASAGLWVAAGKRTFFYAGGKPSDMRPDMKRAHGAVPGSGKVVDGEPFGVSGDVAVWLGTDGTACLGLPGGTLRTLGKRVPLPTNMQRGALLLRQQGGVRQLLATGAGGQAAGFATSATVEVFQYRDGKLINPS